MSEPKDPARVLFEKSLQGTLRFIGTTIREPLDGVVFLAVSSEGIPSFAYAFNPENREAVAYLHAALAKVQAQVISAMLEGVENDLDADDDEPKGSPS